MTPSTPTAEALEAALNMAETCRALTKPEKFSDYGAGLKIGPDGVFEMMPHLATLAAAYRAQQAQLEAMAGVVERIRKLADKYQFDTGAIARGVVQQIRGMAEDALAALPSTEKP